MTHAIAAAVILATITALAALRAHTTPSPAYDYPRWAWRLTLALHAALNPHRHHHAATRRNGTMLTRPRQEP